VIPVVIVAVVLAVVLAIVTSSSSSKKVSTSSTSTTAAGSSTTAAGSPTTAATATPPTAAPAVGATLSGPTPCPKPNGPNPRYTTFKSPPPNCLDPGKTYQATFVTTEGNIVVALDTTKTPMTANNFIVLSRYHYYDGTSMFRTDTSIDIIQGGSPHTQDTSDPGPGYTIKDEGTGFKYAPGDLTMARTSQPNSAGAQYFFCAGPQCSQLNSQGTYVTFGHTTSGQAVLEKILALNVNTSGGLGGAPSHLVLVKSVNIIES
jgi:peptidylprolyl isomerase/peptidyl-prolyl cis-trans isomerase B (cyclophilin B)